MKINNPLTRTHQLSIGSQSWVQMHTNTYMWGQWVYLHRHMWRYPRPDVQMSLLTPTSIAPLAPVRDLAVKYFCYHLTSERRNKKQLFQSHQAFFFFFLRLVSNSAKESKCWTEINCTWSPRARQLVRSPHTETLQQNQIRDQEEAMPETSSDWIYQLKRVHRGWPEQLRSSGKTAKEGHKGQYHLPGWKLKTHAKPIAVLLLFSKPQVVSTEA